MIQTRELPAEEWDRLQTEAIEPFATHGLPDPQFWRILVAEEAGRTVGYSTLSTFVHNDWWLAPTMRGNPAVVRGLWRETREILDANAVSFVYATTRDDPELVALVERMGFLPAPGRLFLLPVDQCILNDNAENGA